jgi:hypothetical protein
MFAEAMDDLQNSLGLGKGVAPYYIDGGFHASPYPGSEGVPIKIVPGPDTFILYYFDVFIYTNVQTIRWRFISYSATAAAQLTLSESAEAFLSMGMAARQSLISA